MDETRRYKTMCRLLVLFISISICIGFTTLGFSIDRFILCIEQGDASWLYIVNTALIFLTSIGFIFGGFVVFSINVKRLENRMKAAGKEESNFICCRNQKQRQIGIMFILYTLVDVILVSLSYTPRIQLETIGKHPMEIVATPITLFFIGIAFVLQSLKRKRVGGNLHAEKETDKKNQA